MENQKCPYYYYNRIAIKQGLFKKNLALNQHFLSLEGISSDSLLTDVSSWSVPVPAVRFDPTK